MSTVRKLVWLAIVAIVVDAIFIAWMLTVSNH